MIAALFVSLPCLCYRGGLLFFRNLTIVDLILKAANPNTTMAQINAYPSPYF
jgi:hypothetical protein